MPACLYTSAAQSRPACGFTWSRPENIVGSLRMADAWTHAEGRGARPAADSDARTIAQAPSDDGHVSA